MEDFISTLPEDIIHSIVSLLPLKHAVTTCVLSTAWRNLWTPIHVNLEIDFDQITSPEVSKQVAIIIGTYLISSNGPKKLYLGSKKWILMATKVEAKELHLNFSAEENQPPTTTDEFNLILDINCPNLENFSASSTFSSLKILHLRSITHLSKNMVAALFSNCRFLETLKLVKCSGLRRLDLKGGNHFESFNMEDCRQVVSIDLSAANLKSFRYRGVLPCIRIKESSRLTDAVLDFRDGPGHNEFDCEGIVSLLAALKDVEILTLSGWLLEWLCSAGVIFGELDFKFNKLKELWWIGSLVDRPKCDSLACFLNFTPFLERLFIDIDLQLSNFPCPFFHHHWHEPHLWMDYATVKSNALPLESLKFVVMVGFKNQKEELLLVDLLLQKTSKLKSVIIKSTETQSDSRRLSKIPNQLTQTWISKCKNVFSVSSVENEWFYGYVEEECRVLRPAHSNMS